MSCASEKWNGKKRAVSACRDVARVIIEDVKKNNTDLIGEIIMKWHYFTVVDLDDGFKYCRNFDFKEFYRTYAERFA